MTREEAKAWFKVLLKDEYAFNSADREAFAMAIKALEQQPCDVFDEYGNYKYPSDVELTEPNAAASMPCEDAINRKATLKPYKDLNDEDTISVWLIRKNIEQQPPVTPQPKAEQFAKWVAGEIFDDMWEYNKDAFAEIACRKLAKLGIVIRMGDEWELVDPQESEEE